MTNSSQRAKELPIPLLRNLQLLEQLTALVEAFGDDAYQLADVRLPGSTIGRQVRHVVDHYTQLLHGLESGCVDYDARARDDALECDRACALGVLTALRKRLATVCPAARGQMLTVACSDAAPSQTSLTRELDFLASHTTHHLALLGLLARELGVTAPVDLGVAFATREHWEATA